MNRSDTGVVGGGGGWISECLDPGALRQLSTVASTHEPEQRVNYRFILLFANCTVKCLDIRSGLGYRKAVTLSKFSCIRLITSFCSFHLFRRKIRFWFGFYNILLHSTWRSFDQLNPSATLLHDYFTFALLVSFVLFLARRNWNPFKIMIKKIRGGCTPWYFRKRHAPLLKRPLPENKIDLIYLVQ